MGTNVVRRKRSGHAYLLLDTKVPFLGVRRFHEWVLIGFHSNSLLPQANSPSFIAFLSAQRFRAAWMRSPQTIWKWFSACFQC